MFAWWRVQHTHVGGLRDLGWLTLVNTCRTEWAHLIQTQLLFWRTYEQFATYSDIGWCVQRVLGNFYDQAQTKAVSNVWGIHQYMHGQYIHARALRAFVVACTLHGWMMHAHNRRTSTKTANSNKHQINHSHINKTKIMFITGDTHTCFAGLCCLIVAPYA